MFQRVGADLKKVSKGLFWAFLIWMILTGISRIVSGTSVGGVSDFAGVLGGVSGVLSGNPLSLFESVLHLAQAKVTLITSGITLVLIAYPVSWFLSHLLFGFAELVEQAEAASADNRRKRLSAYIPRQEQNTKTTECPRKMEIAETGNIYCPKCGLEQPAHRQDCFGCGTKFSDAEKKNMTIRPANTAAALVLLREEPVAEGACELCGKSDERLYPCLRESVDGEQERVYVCKSCVEKRS